MVAEALQGQGNRQAERQGCQHGVAHLAGAGGADKQAVEQVAPHREQWQQSEIGQVVAGGFAHRGDTGLQVDEQVAAKCERQREYQAGQQRPDAGNDQAAPERQTIPRANGVTTQRFHRMGQAIQRVGGDQQAVEQQGVGRHRGVTQPRALDGDQQEHRLQRQRAQENVAVYRQQRAPALPLGHRRPARGARMAAQGAAREQQADQQTAPFGEHRGAGGTDHLPVQAKHEPQRQHDVQQVGDQ